MVIGVFEIKGKMFGHSNDNFVLIPFTAFDHQFPFIKTSGGDTIHIATVPYRPDQVADDHREGARACCAPGATSRSTSRTISRSTRRTS